MQNPIAKLASTPFSLTLIVASVFGQLAAAQVDAHPGAESKALLPASSVHDTAAFATRRATHSADQLFFDTPGDGSIWVRGANYKASFTTEGACMIPWLGSKAPANRPLRLTPESVSIGQTPLAIERAVPATRAGNTIAFDRTSFLERYDITPSAIEQTFVFAELPARGDLVLRLRVHTDLEDHGETSAGLRFECAQGGVNYGRATALDAAGKQASIETHYENGSIVIRIPAAFVESAVLPLTIDPVISVFAIDPTFLDDYLPDVAYDPSTSRYMVCYEERFSATDHDVYEEMFDANGVLISGTYGNYIDITANNWQRPRIANNAWASQFMVVAQFGAAPNRGIISRVASAGANLLGNQVFVDAPYMSWDQVNPVIGGNPDTGPNTLYLVVWEFAVASTGARDIVQIGMRTTGVPDAGAPTCIDCSTTTHDFNPAISKSSGSTSGLHSVWNVVWESEFSPSDHDIYGAQQFNMAIFAGPYPINLSVYDDRRPTVSSFAEGSSAPGNYLVAYDEDFGPEHDILGQVMNGSSSLSFASLSYLEGPNFQNQDQIAPSADSDGCTFAVAYAESYGTSTTDYDVYISTFNLVGGAIDCIEPHQNLAYTVAPELDVRISASRGGAPQRYLGAWTVQATGNSDIWGGLYDSALIVAYCLPGSDGVSTCPCNNPPVGSGGCNNSVGTGGAGMYASGTASLASDTLSLGQTGELPSSLSIFLQGNANTMFGTIFGDGVRCVGGSLKRLFVHNASAGGVSAPVGTDSAVSVRSSALGDTIQACQTRYYQVYYRDPNLGFCAGGFNVGNGLKVTWLP